MGKADIRKHSRSQIHLNLAKACESQSRLSVVSQSSQLIKTTEAEVKMAVLTSCFNIPLTFHDHLSPFIRSTFSDFRVAEKYHAASTKAMCMLDYAIAPLLKQHLIEYMKVHPFSVAVDGSNDNSLLKMNPMAI